MKFPAPLIRGTLIKRYKRFLADVELADGTVVTAHCANSGSMLSVNAPGSEVWLSPAQNPERKLRYTWELIRVGTGLVGINTSNPNRLATEGVETGIIAELSGYDGLRREVKYGRNSRIDLLLEGDGQPKCFVEVKNVTLKRDLDPTAPAEFPDAVTTRGTKHLRELADMVRDGARAVMLYLVQRDDCGHVTMAGDIDPMYAEEVLRARDAGVEVIAYGCALSPEEITVTTALPVRL